MTAAERRRLALAPFPVVRVHGRSPSMAGASVRRRGAKRPPAGAAWIRHGRPRADAPRR